MFYNGEIRVELTADEDGKTVCVFKDCKDRIILKRYFSEESTHDTYYVYDDLGNLRYVLPPSLYGEISKDMLDKYAYQYRYDHRNRCIWKNYQAVAPYIILMITQTDWSFHKTGTSVQQESVHFSFMIS